MKSPIGIEFTDDCLGILSHSLLAVKPQEGCALLIGDEKQSSSFNREHILRVQMIWPCCNIWGINIFNLAESPIEIQNNRKKDLSKENRFAIDPREQICAQRWARKRNWKIIGNAHSHPNGNASPSFIDDYWTFTSGLSIIIGKSGCIRAWWMSSNQTVPPQEVAILGLK